MRVSTVGHLLRRLVGLAAARPIWTLVLSCLLAAAGVVCALTTLTLETSQRDLLPQRQPSIRRSDAYAGEFGDLDDIAIVVEALIRPRQGREAAPHDASTGPHGRSRRASGATRP
jgi:hypothetical protein